MTTSSMVRFTNALFRHSRGYPFATNLSLVSIPIGILAIILGPEVSRAFTLIINRPEPIYIWGVVLLVGGVNVAWGIGWGKPSLERAGLFFLAFGYLIYGVSVMIGLRVGGMVAGPFAIAMAISCVQRSFIISKAAKALMKATAEADVVRALGDVMKL